MPLQKPGYVLDLDVQSSGSISTEFDGDIDLKAELAYLSNLLYFFFEPLYAFVVL